MANTKKIQTPARPHRRSSHHFDPRAVLSGLPPLAFAFNDEPGGEGGEGAPPANPPAAPPGEGEQMLPQSRVSAIVQERLDRERRASQERLASLGYGSFEELEQAHAVRAKEAEAARRREQEAEAERLRRIGDAEGMLEHEQRLAAEREEQLRNELESERAARVQLEQTTARARERAVLVDSAQRSGAVNPDQVAQLLAGRVRSGDDGRVYVLDEAGQPMSDGAGANLEVGAFVASWVAGNPHFQRAAGGAGAGSRGGGNPPPEAIDPKKLTDINYVRKQRAALLERERGK